MLVALGFFLASYTTSLDGLYICLRRHRRPRQRVRVCHAHAGGLEVVSRQARAGRRSDGRRIRRRVGDPRPVAHTPHRHAWAGGRPCRFSAAVFFVMTMIGTALHAEPAAGLSAAELAAEARRGQAGADFTTREMLRRRPSTSCGSRTAWARRPDRWPSASSCPSRVRRGSVRWRRPGAPGQRHRQRRRPNLVRLDVRYARPTAHASRSWS